MPSPGSNSTEVGIEVAWVKPIPELEWLNTRLLII